MSGDEYKMPLQCYNVLRMDVQLFGAPYSPCRAGMLLGNQLHEADQLVTIESGWGKQLQEGPSIRRPFT